MEIIINGVTLQGDFMDADFMEVFETATRKMQEKALVCQRKQYSSVAEGYREQCEVVDEYFDDIFGPGTAVEIFAGAEHNIMTHLTAVEELTDQGMAAKKKLNDFTNKYTQRQNAQLQRGRNQQVVSGKKHR